MRKQLARVGAIAVAAMMVGTTAFAADPAKTEVRYTGLNTVEVSVTAAGVDDQVTILAVDSTVKDLAQVQGANIAYINQEPAEAEGSVIAAVPSAGQTFTFDTAGPTSAKEFAVYGGGDGNTISGVKTYWKTAPVESMTFADTSTIEVAANADDAAIKEALKGVNVTLTHDTTAADPVTTTIMGNDPMLSYTTVGADGKTTATLDPSKKADGQEFTTTTTVTAPVQLQVEEEQEEPIASAVELVPSSSNLTVQKGTEKADITPQFLLDSGWTLKARYTMAQGAQLPDYVMTASDFTATVTNDVSPYNVTIHSTKTDFANGVPAPADITITVTVSTEDTVAITGTVQYSNTLDGTPAAAKNALVAVYDGETLVDVDVTDDAGAFSIQVAPGKAYRVVASYLNVALRNGAVYRAVNYGAKVVDLEANATNAGTIVLYQLTGDANGDGRVNGTDTAVIGTGYGAIGNGSYFEQ